MKTEESANVCRDLRALPKAHLHLHIDGAVRLETLKELAAGAGMNAPEIPPDGQGYLSFGDFVRAIESVQPFLSDLVSLRRIVKELVEDAVRDGAIWIEPSVFPGFFGPIDSLSTRRAVMTILDAGQTEAAAHGAGFGLMLSANRRHGLGNALEVAQLAVECSAEGVVSFGLDGDESAAPPQLFQRAFAIARGSGLLATPHAGEFLGAQSVACAVEVLGAARIGHGVRAIERIDVVEMLVDTSVCIDVCPTSNLKLGVFRDVSQHPLPLLLAAGVMCSLNADDPLLFGSSLLGEYELCRREFGFDDSTLAEIARTSLVASGGPRSLIASGGEAIETWLGGTT